MNLKLSHEQLKDAYEKKGYRFFDDGAYNVNLYGIRNSGLDVDEWNDICGLDYRCDNGNPVNLMHRGSTKPGLYWLKKKMGNINGTAILIPGQYRGAWKIGQHKGYEALQQKSEGVFKVWRDNDGDGRFDYSGDVYDDVTGLNMHTESLEHDTERVGAYSAGCQVRANSLEHFAVMMLLRISAKKYGNSFTYTLFDERDFI